VRELVREVGLIYQDENNFGANCRIKHRLEKSGACRCRGKFRKMHMVFDVAIAKPVVVARFHLTIPLLAKRIPKLPGAIGGVSMNLWPKESQHLPALCL